MGADAERAAAEAPLVSTAGTVPDMGRTLTHETIVGEMSLGGLTTQEIARRIYHTTEAVDSYLRAFERVLLMRHYRIPRSVMPRVSGYSPSLVSEHLALADRHFPTAEAADQHLISRGVDLAESGSG